jgi:hypothetical protein
MFSVVGLVGTMLAVKSIKTPSNQTYKEIEDTTSIPPTPVTIHMDGVGLEAGTLFSPSRPACFVFAQQ